MNCCCNTELHSLLRNIVRLQREAVRAEVAEEFCDANRLGCGRREEFNTRPLQIFTEGDRPWHCPINRNNAACSDMPDTCTFRCEKIEGCLATFRALIPLNQIEQDGNNPCSGGRYIATDSFITVKLENIAAIRCLNDCFVELCIR